MAKVLIVGKNSFIGKSLSKVKDGNIFKKISYKNLYNVDLKNYDVVVNCSLHPSFKTSSYHLGIDVDYDVAHKSYLSGCHYIMLSTRKIYGSSTALKTYNEESEENPYDHYSENKLKSEKKILSQFGDRSTVIRGSNLFGYELGRNSMMGWFLNQLDKDGTIRYNVLSTTSKDIIHVDDASKIISKVCSQQPLGLYNLGTSYPYSMLGIGIHLLDGFNHGILENRMKFDGEIYGEQFILDTKKICSTLNIETPSVHNYPKLISDIGAKLSERSSN